MYITNLIFKNCSSALSLSYKAFKSADETYKKAMNGVGTIVFEDDYEQRASVDMSTVAAVSFGDIEKDFDRQGAVQILQHKAQLRSQVNAQNDKGLALLSDAARGPAAAPPSLIKSN